MTIHSDYIRLNLKELSDFPKMLVEKAFEFLNIEIKDLSLRLNFTDVSNSHGAPIGKKTNWGGRDPDEPRSYLGWQGQIYCVVLDKRENNHYWSTSAGQVLFGSGQFYDKYGNGFNGFHTGTGCPGYPNGNSAMNISFYFFLDDFPLLKSNYEKWKSLTSFKNEKEDWKNIKLKYGQFINKDWI